jgi:membrane protease YdiL (CAAX protease family)
MQKSDSQHIREIRERLSKISLKKGFLTMLFFIILTAAGCYLALDELNINSPWQDIILQYAIYMVPFLLVIWVLRETNHLFSFFKRDSKELSQVLMAIPLIVISIGVVWMIILILNLISTGVAENYLNWLNNAKLLNLGPEATLIQYVLFLGLITIVAPVVEEVIFRGIMIERLGAKYNYGWAVIISSVIFGILHSNPVGAFISGVILSLVYLKTKTLKGPIVIHIANNTIAAFFMIADEKLAFSDSSWETVEPYISNGWIGILLFITGIVWLSWYIKQNCQSAIEMEPFKLKAEKN